MDFTNGKGVDLVIDPIGTKNWKSSYRVLAKMGKLIIYGDQNLVKGDKLKPIVAMKEMYSMPKYRPMDLMSNNKAVMGYHLDIKSIGLYFGIEYISFIATIGFNLSPLTRF
jgi:hypothetical protein